MKNRNRYKEIYHSIPEGCNRESQSCKSKVVETPDKSIRGWVATETTESCGRQLPGWIIPDSRGWCLVNNRRWNNAFTLIELLVVVLIIGILSAIALPQYEKTVIKIKVMRLIVGSRIIAEAQRVNYMENNFYARSNDLLSISYPTTGKNYYLVNGALCNIASPDRVSCSLTNPTLVIQRVYSQPEHVICCSYSTDNYAGDDICKQLLPNKVWSNGCSPENPCHCYK